MANDSEIAGRRDRVSFAERGRNIAIELVRKIESELGVPGGRVMVAFQRIDKAARYDGLSGVLRYTPLLHTPVTQTAWRERIGRVRAKLGGAPAQQDRVILLAIVAEGLYHGITGKELWLPGKCTDVPPSLVKRIDQCFRWAAALERGTLPGGWKALLANLSEGACDKSSIMELWARCQDAVEEAVAASLPADKLCSRTCEPVNCNFGFRLAALLQSRDMPQQSLKAGYASRLADEKTWSPHTVSTPIQTPDYARMLSRENFWEDFKNNVDWAVHAGDSNRQELRRGSFASWLEYCVLTAFEFYATGGPEGYGNSTHYMTPIYRSGEPFGLFFVFITDNPDDGTGKDGGETYCKPPPRNVPKLSRPSPERWAQTIWLKGLVETVRPQLQEYADKFDSLLCREFTEKVQRLVLNSVEKQPSHSLDSVLLDRFLVLAHEAYPYVSTNSIVVGKRKKRRSKEEDVPLSEKAKSLVGVLQKLDADVGDFDALSRVRELEASDAPGPFFAVLPGPLDDNWKRERVFFNRAVFRDGPDADQWVREWRFRWRTAWDDLNDYIELVQPIRTALSDLLKRSAGTAILVESYAHNIGAHSLAGFRELVDDWRKRLPAATGKGNSELAVTAWAVANLEKLGQHELAQAVRNYSQFSEYVWYLEGKSAFWNAVTGGRVYGGGTSYLWDLLDGLARNNLFCGSLCATERKRKRENGTTTGISGVEFRLHEGENGEPTILGVSDLDDDKRFRFEEETGDQCGGRGQLDAYRARTGIQLNDTQYNAVKMLRDWLRKPESRVYLPGGIVGAHAFYTIVENVARNVKHCKIPAGAIPLPLCLRVKEESERFTLTIWLDLEAEDGTEGEAKTVQKSIDEIVDWDGLLDNDNAPVMGGTSQNVLCAGLLLGDDFVETERKQLTAGTAERPLVPTDEAGHLAWQFRVWKGDDIKRWEELKSASASALGPVGRFRIITLCDRLELWEFLSETSSIRHAVGDFNGNFAEAYKSWVKEAVCSSKHYPQGISVMIDNERTAVVKDGQLTTEGNAGSVPEESARFLFAHGERRALDGWGSPIKYKQHIGYGPIIRDKLRDTVLRDKDKLPYWCELLETAALKIGIVDGRLYNAYKDTLSGPEQDVLKRLGVQAVEEDEKLLNGLTPGHFLVVHLSFLEMLLDKGGFSPRWTSDKSNKGTLAVRRFLEGKTASNFDFIIVTTGRARDWQSGLGRNELARVRYIPIENLKACFRDGPRLDSDSLGAGVKFALVKAILGS